MNVDKTDPLIHFPCRKLETTEKMKWFMRALHIDTINYFDDYV